jgi:amino acid transporter
VEVTIGTALLAWAMLSLPKDLGPAMKEDHEHMLRFMAEAYGSMNFGPGFGYWSGIVVGVIIGALLLSAVNTAIAATIGLLYMLSRDGEMPAAFTSLNRHGVPKLPLAVSVILLRSSFCSRSPIQRTPFTCSPACTPLASSVRSR